MYIQSVRFLIFSLKQIVYAHHYYPPTQGDKRPNQAKLKQAKRTCTDQMSTYLRQTRQYSRMAETELILQTGKVQRVETNKVMKGGAPSNFFYIILCYSYQSKMGTNIDINETARPHQRWLQSEDPLRKPAWKLCLT